MPKTFSPFVAEEIGWYVYALQDPRDNKVFYIGKGKDNRVFAHAEGVVPEDEFESGSKNHLIKEILQHLHRAPWPQNRSDCLRHRIRFD